MTGGPRVRSHRSLRLACAAGAVAAVAFALYISLVPFSFHHGMTLQQAFSRLRGSSARHVVSFSNFAGNILMFVPVGVFGAGAVLRARDAWIVRAMLCLLVLAGSAASSIGIEWLQALVPTRTPSLVDCEAQVLGAAIGILGAAAVSSEVWAWWERRHTDGDRGISRVWLVFYAAAYAIAAWLPLDVTLSLGTLARKFRAGRIILSPWHSPLTAASLQSMLGDIVFAVPLGFLAAMAGAAKGRRHPVALALALSAAVLVFVEAGEIIVMSRTADVEDVVVAIVGAALGIGIASLIATPAPARDGGADARTTGGRHGWSVVIAALLVAMAVYAGYNWSPFNPTFDPAIAKARIPMLWRPPFYSYYENPELKALGEIVVKTALGAPLGFLWTTWVFRRFARAPRTALIAGLLAFAAFFVVVELGQVVLPSRYPDNTDVLLGLAGVVAGGIVARVV